MPQAVLQAGILCSPVWRRPESLLQVLAPSVSSLPQSHTTKIQTEKGHLQLKPQASCEYQRASLSWELQKL